MERVPISSIYKKQRPMFLICRPKYEFKNEKSKCLISYYGATNETCWYKSNTESIEADFQDTLGEHQVGSITQ